MECSHITRGNNKSLTINSSRVLPRWAVLSGVDTVAVWADDTDDYQGQFESGRPLDLWSPTPPLSTAPESPLWKLL